MARQGEFKMKKISFFLIWAMVGLFAIACKSVTNPEPPQKTNDIVEFMYVRDLPIISPGDPDTKGSSIWSDEFKGINMPPWTPAGQNTWGTEKTLYYSKKLYHIYTIDMKVTNGYVAVADTFYARVKGTQDWIKLSTSSKGDIVGKWADFYLNQEGIQTLSSQEQM